MTASNAPQAHTTSTRRRSRYAPPRPLIVGSDERDGHGAVVHAGDREPWVGGGRYLAIGDVSIGDLGVYLGTEIQADGDYDSLATMLAHEIGEVPKRGAEVQKFV